MIEVRDLHVRYGGIVALDGVCLDIPDGKIVSIVGANGAGKSTTINALSGMVRVHSGSITMDGQSLLLAPQEIVKKGIVQVPEGRRIFPTITVRENLLLGAYIVRERRRIEAALERVYGQFPVLKERQGQLGGTLSGGEQQMLAFARALMSEPKVLIMDEPSLGLAPMFVLSIFKMIQELNRAGHTMLLVEQNAQKALAIADYAYVLETGRIVAQGEGRKIAADPIVKKAYLGIEEG